MWSRVIAAQGCDSGSLDIHVRDNDQHGFITERLSRTITFASTVFYGHATDMNVHPTFDRVAIAPKT